MSHETRRGAPGDTRAGDPAPLDIPGPAGTGPPPVAGPPRFPKRYLYYAAYAILGLLLVLALGAYLIGRFAPTGTTSSTPTGSIGARADRTFSGGAPPPSSHALEGSLAAFMDVNSLKESPAPPFTLTDAETGARVSLSSLLGHVVVLTFANAQCNDICPVLASELHKAASLLASTREPVTFITVNTDPLDTQPGSVPIVRQSAFATMAHWQFLTGTIHQLDPVWKAYGVSITVNETTRQVAHNDPLYFVTARGRLRWSATVFADESRHGRFTLPESQIDRYAQGVARYASMLADRR
jgi:cytochrome oxidase Cu insertion factor (SCO1/SenC/PrrC family)